MALRLDNLFERCSASSPSLLLGSELRTYTSMASRSASLWVIGLVLMLWILEVASSYLLSFSLFYFSSLFLARFIAFSLASFSSLLALLSFLRSFLAVSVSWAFSSASLSSSSPASRLTSVILESFGSDSAPEPIWPCSLSDSSCVEFRLIATLK